MKKDLENITKVLQILNRTSYVFQYQWEKNLKDGIDFREYENRYKKGNVIQKDSTKPDSNLFILESMYSKGCTSFENIMKEILDMSSPKAKLYTDIHLANNPTHKLQLGVSEISCIPLEIVDKYKHIASITSFDSHYRIDIDL